MFYKRNHLSQIPFIALRILSAAASKWFQIQFVNTRDLPVTSWLHIGENYVIPSLCKSSSVNIVSHCSNPVLIPDIVTKNRVVRTWVLTLGQHQSRTLPSCLQNTVTKSSSRGVVIKCIICTQWKTSIEEKW